MINSIEWDFTRNPILKSLVSVLILGVSVAVFYVYTHNQSTIVQNKKDAIEQLSDADIDKYLSSISSANNNKDFHDMTDTLISNIISKKANEFGLRKDELARIITAYHSSNTDIINGIHKEIIDKKNLKVKSDIYYENLESIKGFSESIAGLTCKLASIAKLPPPANITQELLKSVVIDSKCKAILTNYIEPISKKLQEHGIIKDTNIIVSKLQDQIRTSILKLASAQDTIIFNIDYTQKRDYNLLIVDFSRESTLNASINAIIIAGFDLSSYTMKVDHNKRTLDIHLPAPTIISNNTNVFFQKASTESGAPEIDSETYNMISNKAKIKALNSVKKEKLFNDAKKNAYASIINIFQPLMSLPQFNYTVNVYFDHKIYSD